LHLGHLTVTRESLFAPVYFHLYPHFLHWTSTPSGSGATNAGWTKDLKQCGQTTLLLTAPV